MYQAHLDSEIAMCYAYLLDTGPGPWPQNITKYKTIETYEFDAFEESHMFADDLHIVFLCPLLCFHCRCLFLFLFLIWDYSMESIIHVRFCPVAALAPKGEQAN